MISEKQLSDSFDSFWQHHFPLLGPTFTRRLNAEGERLTDSHGDFVPPVAMGNENIRFDLAAELAFEMARSNYESNLNTTPISTESIIAKAFSRINLFHKDLTEQRPSEAELTEANRLVNVYDAFFAFDASTDIIFRPRIKGVGILSEMEADFCNSTTLYEVKAVNRNIQSADLRQIICYLVAALGSGQYSWTRYCIFNPRLARVHCGNISNILSYTSGRTPYDCITEVTDALMEREQPLETRF